MRGDLMTGKSFKCPFCSYEWISKVAEPKECPGCKRMLATSSSQDYSLTPEEVKELTEDFDKYLSVKKTFEYSPYNGTNHIFSWEEGKVRYRKIAGGVELRNKLVDSSYEILKSWAIVELMKRLK